MPRKPWILLSVATLVPSLVLAQAYKCNLNGGVVYQQQPCEGGSKLDLPPSPDPNSREERVARAVARKRVFVGMTEQEVIRAWGKPSKINRSVTASTVHEQWIYEQGEIGRSQYLYLENGVLGSIQSPE